MDRLFTEEDHLLQHRFCFFPEDPANPRSKQLRVTTKFIRSVDKQSYLISQSLNLNSYDGESEIKLFEVKITPERLRLLADELEQAHERAKQNLEALNSKEGR